MALDPVPGQEMAKIGRLCILPACNIMWPDTQDRLDLLQIGLKLRAVPVLSLQKAVESQQIIHPGKMTPQPAYVLRTDLLPRLDGLKTGVDPAGEGLHPPLQAAAAGPQAQAIYQVKASILIHTSPYANSNTSAPTALTSSPGRRMAQPSNSAQYACKM